MDVLIPEIEDNVPLPKNAQEAFPDLSPTEELNMRASVVQLLSDLTGQPISPNKENQEEAKAFKPIAVFPDENNRLVKQG